MEKRPVAVKSGETVVTILVVDDKPAYMPLLTHLLRTVYQYGLPIQARTRCFRRRVNCIWISSA
jgi:hypothetical protein